MQRLIGIKFCTKCIRQYVFDVIQRRIPYSAKNRKRKELTFIDCLVSFIVQEEVLLSTGDLNKKCLHLFDHQSSVMRSALHPPQMYNLTFMKDSAAKKCQRWSMNPADKKTPNNNQMHCSSFQPPFCSDLCCRSCGNYYLHVLAICNIFSLATSEDTGTGVLGCNTLLQASPFPRNWSQHVKNVFWRFWLAHCRLWVVMERMQFLNL